MKLLRTPSFRKDARTQAFTPRPAIFFKVFSVNYQSSLCWPRNF